MATTVPVNVYRGPRRLMVATHLPGLEPQNIQLTVEGERLSIQGMLRGVRQERRPGYVQRERTAHPVSGTITMAKIGTAKGQCRRHVGHDLRPI